MKKQLVMINGTMGVGKSTVSQTLFKQMNGSAYLDGDWCWNMHPFIVNEENKAMVMRNILFMLRSYLSNSSFKTVIFCWVMHEEAIRQELLAGLADLEFDDFAFSLICDEATLQQHFQLDAQTGLRNIADLAASLARMPLYQRQSTIEIDISQRTVPQIVAEIEAYLELNHK